MSFQSATTLTKIAFIAMCIGLLLFIIGFSTDFWVKAYGHRGIYVHLGLWGFAAYMSFWQATQAMECIGLILGVIALILVILYLFVDQFRGNKNIVLYSLVSAIAAGIFITIGIIIWGTHYPSYQLGWSFALACVGGVFLFLAGLLLIPEKKPQLI
ncbi:uncharacterized protein LOC135468702 isoform X2 [Liolophura sinensis]|uniref:uncharacterized protein LOC135468702 isoform X2 n=1 Tax=Liolophura sinensis TaxID=3198878 RepID=UPI0031581B2B